MRSLIYLFMAIVSLSAGAMVYFGLSFTPIEAALLVLIVGLGCWLLLELTLRRRAQMRLEKALEDLSRVQSRDALANQNLTEKVEALLGRDLNTRVGVLEADVSVLGTVVRQVAESVAELEERMAAQGAAEKAGAPAAEPAPASVPSGEPDPVIPLELLGQALEEDRLIFHMQPIVTLPQRKTYGYQLVPRLMMEDGELADAPDFMPRRGGEKLVVRIERLLLETAATVVRRARAREEPLTVFLPVTTATLTSQTARDQMAGALDANRAIAPNLVFVVDDAEFQNLTSEARDALDSFVRRGAVLCLNEAQTLRREIADLARDGVNYISVDAQRFIERPQTLTDFHAADVADYLARFDVTLIARDVDSESQILSLLDDGVGMAEGDHIAPPSPIRSDLLADEGEQEDEAESPVRQVNR